MTIAGRSLKPRYSPSTTLIAAVALLLILFVASTSLFFLPEEEQISPGMQALSQQNEAMHSEWLAKRPDEFRYVVERGCFCAAAYMRPYAVSHEQGKDDIAWFRASGDDTYPPAPPEPVSIDDLFELIATAAGAASSLEVSYNSRFAYPTRVVIDWSADVADDEQRFDVRDFEVLRYN